ncbi:tetratricopeptide repeat protein [uncultured Aquabacterium sp.]|uniref:tetratricopeptide repeat protein n=1 Tax=uncultured Aquabacterium sp. TaxID=158753 RepID=UPI0030CDC094
MTTPAPPALSPQDEARLIALFNAGRHADLERLARDFTRQHPQSGFAWKVLGTAQMLQRKDGVAALRQAAELMPDDAESWSNLGNAQKAQGALADAEASHRRAVQLRPTEALKHYNLATVLAERGQLRDAEAAYREALRLQPGLTDAHHNLGLVLEQDARDAEAATAYRAAIALQPTHANALCNLGAVLGRLGQFAEAQSALRQALALDPRLAQAHHNLGVVCCHMHALDEACAALRTAAKLDPQDAEARQALGDVLRQMRRYDEATLTLKRALALNPQHADAWVDLGNVHKDLGELDEAIACYERAKNISPEQPEPHHTLLMTGNYLPDMDSARLLAQAKAFGAWASARAEGHRFTDWPNTLEPDRTLRIGLVSGDLYAHPVGHFLEGAMRSLHALAGERLRLFAYATQPFRDALTERLQACTHGWQTVAGWSDLALAERIRADGIDILIDLSGHTAHNRLPMFALKPAPVQLSWLGYFATTGLAEMDHLLADPVCLPPELEGHFTEHIWRLPETRLCFTPPQDDVPVAPLPALKHGGITFGCFNNLSKVHEGVVTLWCRILQAVPNSRLLLKAPQLASAQVRQAMQARFRAHGVSGERLLLQTPSTRTEYLQAYAQVDIALDPFPFTGGTTSAEGLWMGVPVLTLAGQSLIARQGVGLMVNAGLPDWVADTPDDCVAKAVAHTADLAKLATLRSGLRAQLMRSPLFDAQRFAHHLDAALRGMWRAHCERQR